MKSALLFAVAAVTISSVPLLAHQAATGAQSSASAGVSAQSAHPPQASAAAQGSAGASAATPHASASAGSNSSASAAASMRPVHAELMQGLDSKSARVGETVTAKTTQSFRTADGAEIPKGSHLIGHVTQVQSHGHGHDSSSLGIVFDRAQLKGGQSLPIRSMIESVSPSASAMALANADNQESMDAMAPMGGSPAMGARGGGGGVARGGGGLVGGTVNSATSATGNLSGNAAGLGSSANGALDSTSSLAANTTGSLHGAVSQTSGAAASLGTHATGLPGVMLNSTASGATSGVLSASGRNVHLDSGTQMVLGVAAAAR